MATAPTTSDAASLPAPGVPRKSRLLPGWGVRIIVAVCLVVLVLVRTIQPLEATPPPLNDAAVANILTLILSFIAFMTVLVWFGFRSGYARSLRWSVLAALGLAASFFAVSLALGHMRMATPLRFAGVDGNMVPRFEIGWQPEENESVGAVEAVAPPAGIDLARTSDTDFPRFLGPQGTAYLAGPELDRNWAANPPKELWRRPIGAGWSGFASVNGYAVTLEQRGDDEWVTCYDIATGEPAWGHAIQARHYNPLGGLGPRSTPTIHAGKVYTLGATGVLQCLDGRDGSLVWSDDLRKRYFGDKPAEELAQLDEALVQWGRAGSPLIVDDLVVVPAGGPADKAKSLIAYRADRGEVVWEAGDDQVSYASPALAMLGGIRQILSVNEKTVTGHDPATGNVLWKHDWPGSSMQDANNSQPVPLPGDRVFVSKGYGAGAAILTLVPGDAGGLTVGPKVLANRKVLETKFTNVVVIGEHGYGLSNGILECADLVKLRKQWKQGRYGHGQILGVGDVILVQAEQGDLALVEANPERFVELGRIPALSGKTWNNLCLVGKKLLVRNDREAACYELP